MRKSKRRVRIALLAILSVGTALQVGANGCAEFYTKMAISTFDFCSLFNCEGGTYFNFCTPTFQLLLSCPNLTTTTP